MASAPIIVDCSKTAKSFPYRVNGVFSGCTLTNNAAASRVFAAKGASIIINKVWGMVFGNGVSLGDAHSLHFTAGPHNEFDGLFGKLTFDHPDTSKAAPASTAKL